MCPDVAFLVSQNQNGYFENSVELKEWIKQIKTKAGLPRERIKAKGLLC